MIYAIVAHIGVYLPFQNESSIVLFFCFPFLFLWCCKDNAAGYEHCGNKTLQYTFSQLPYWSWKQFVACLSPFHNCKAGGCNQDFTTCRWFNVCAKSSMFKLFYMLRYVGNKKFKDKRKYILVLGFLWNFKQNNVFCRMDLSLSCACVKY